jgi:hypothetical protein
VSYKKLIKDTLAPLGIPVAFQSYSGDAKTYITYSCYLEQGEEWAEDEEIATGFYVQVDIWSKADYTTLEGQVKIAMLSAGFKRTSAQDFYENDTKTYHKALRFFMLSN